MASIESLIMLLLYLIIFGTILYVLNWIVASLAFPQPVRHAILLVLSVLALIWLLSMVGVF